jgi:hypothetical protein
VLIHMSARYLLALADDKSAHRLPAHRAPHVAERRRWPAFRHEGRFGMANESIETRSL